MAQCDESEAAMVVTLYVCIIQSPGSRHFSRVGRRLILSHLLALKLSDVGHCGLDGPAGPVTRVRLTLLWRGRESGQK